MSYAHGARPDRLQRDVKSKMFSAKLDSTVVITYAVSEVRLLLQHADMSKSDTSIWYDQCMINVGRCLLSTARKSRDLKSTICILNGWSYESCRRRRWPNPCFNARITSKPFGWRKQKKTFGERKLFAYPKHSSQNTRAIKEMLQLPIQKSHRAIFLRLVSSSCEICVTFEIFIFFLEGPLCAHDVEHNVPRRAHREALKNWGIFPQYNPLQSFLIEPWSRNNQKKIEAVAFPAKPGGSADGLAEHFRKRNDSTIFIRSWILIRLIRLFPVPKRNHCIAV